MPTSNNVLEEKHERRKTKTNKQNVGFLVTFYIFSSSFLLQELSYSYFWDCEREFIYFPNLLKGTTKRALKQMLDLGAFSLKQHIQYFLGQDY